MLPGQPCDGYVVDGAVRSCESVVDEVTVTIRVADKIQPSVAERTSRVPQHRE